MTAPRRDKAASDFRYGSGPARVPWAAVGEPVGPAEISRIVGALVRPAAGKTRAYNAQVAKVAREVEGLWRVGQPVGKLTLGGHVSALEEQAAKFLGVKHALFTSSWTLGAEIAYKYAGLRPGDEVIAPALTFIASIAYPLSIGAKVVLADVDPRTLNMDPADVRRKVTPRTKVILPVHLGGYPVDMAPIMKLARERDIVVIEDGAHAIGAAYRGKMVGSIGHFGAFSFHEVKNITALGEGGLLCTNLDWAREMRMARFLGLDLSRQIPKWLYDVVTVPGKEGGFVANNCSATEVQAVCLASQLRRLNGIIAKRKRAATYLNARLEKVRGLVTPLGDGPQVKTTYHLYLLQVAPDELGGDIQALKAKLQDRGVVQIPHFAPLYKFSILGQLGYDRDAIQASCPVAEEAFQRRFTHLPLYDFTVPQLKYMADAIADAAAEVRAGR